MEQKKTFAETYLYLDWKTKRDVISYYNQKVEIEISC
jgi:hypothetical protein